MALIDKVNMIENRIAAEEEEMEAQKREKEKIIEFWNRFPESVEQKIIMPLELPNSFIDILKEFILLVPDTAWIQAPINSETKIHTDQYNNTQMFCSENGFFQIFSLDGTRGMVHYDVFGARDITYTKDHDKFGIKRQLENNYKIKCKNLSDAVSSQNVVNQYVKVKYDTHVSDSDFGPFYHYHSYLIIFKDGNIYDCELIENYGRSSSLSYSRHSKPPIESEEVFSNTLATGIVEIKKKQKLINT